MEDYASSDDGFYFEEEEDEERDSCLGGIQEIDNDISSLSNKGSSTKGNDQVGTLSMKCPMPIPSVSPKPKQKCLRMVITQDSLVAAQREDLRRIMDMLSVREHHARTLLIHFRWDAEKVLELFVEGGKDKLFAAAGVKVLEHSAPCSSGSCLACDICMEDRPADEFTSMDCGHYFCNECWTEHFIVKINEGQSRRIRCMAHKCNSICDDTKVRTLVNFRDPQLADKFDRFILESYIEDNKRVKWCPSVPHCGNAIRVEDDEFCEVECSCGLQFCFSCSFEAHSPCSCTMWELWLKKCRDESETVNWITVNTKPCPKCQKPVEKSGGCNLVVCVCGQAFCWLCGGATGREHTWSNIANHSCGRYKEDKKKRTERAKKELWRYIHYHNRYKAHTDSYKLEAKLKETIHQKVAVLEQRESTSKDFSWVTNGLNRLFRSRRVLSYSYPFAFYMFGDDLFKNEMTNEVREIKQNLFEDQQQQLEANVEKLSMCLEEPFSEYDEDKITGLRMQIITMSGIVDNLCKKMFECIENDLLGSLQNAIHIIAPYKSKGVDKATELSVKQSSQAQKTDSDRYSNSNGGEMTGTHEPSSSMENQGESGRPSRKRARSETIGDRFFDLNLPADVTNEI